MAVQGQGRKAFFYIVAQINRVLPGGIDLASAFSIKESFRGKIFLNPFSDLGRFMNIFFFVEQLAQFVQGKGRGRRIVYVGILDMKGSVNVICGYVETFHPFGNRRRAQ